MKTIILSIISVFSITLHAQDYYWVYSAQSQKLDLPETVAGVNVRDRSGDLKDYRVTKLPLPALLPALVDAQSGDMIFQPTGTIRQAMAKLRSQQRDAVQAETPKFFDAFTLSTNTMSLIGTNRQGFAKLRYDGTKLSAAQREIYQTECIYYLAGRLQLLERELKRKQIVNIKDMVDE